MKIEMCESLLYSWLRHVKGCQLVQSNWKPSPTWTVENRERVEEFMKKADLLFQDKHGYTVFKSSSFSQLISQAESDIVGMCFSGEKKRVFSVETAFHKAGLNYKGNEESVAKIIKKWARSALCIAGHFNVLQGELIFASPKIHNGAMNGLNICAQELNNLFAENGFGFNARIIANEDFKNEVLVPVLEISGSVNDTTELFMRSYQLVNMFDGVKNKKRHSEISGSSNEKELVRSDEYGNYKIGQLARTVFRSMLESGAASEEEIELLQKAYYSKEKLHLNYPALAAVDSDYDPDRYYSTPLSIYGKLYMLCNDWYEKFPNNDRPYLLMWIETHRDKI